MASSRGLVARKDVYFSKIVEVVLKFYIYYGRSNHIKWVIYTVSKDFLKFFFFDLNSQRIQKNE